MALLKVQFRHSYGENEERLNQISEYVYCISPWFHFVQKSYVNCLFNIEMDPKNMISQI